MTPLRAMPVLVLLLTFTALRPVCAVEPTLARLTFVVAPERKADFERLYDEKLVPILLGQGFVPSTETGRATGGLGVLPPLRVRRVGLDRSRVSCVAEGLIVVFFNLALVDHLPRTRRSGDGDYRWSGTDWLHYSLA